MPDTILIESDGPVRILTLNRPDSLNSANAEMHTRLADIWREVAADRDARAVVLTGAGRAFSAGGDFEFMLASQDPQRRWEASDEGRRILEEMLRFPLPVVAAVNGPAVGLGATLAALSDMVLIAEHAHLADPHVVVGLVAGDGGAASWPAHMSLLHAKEFLLLGDRIDAERAVAIGLANRVVPADDLQREALALAHRFAALPAHAAQDTKRALNLVIEQSLASTRHYALVAERYSMSDTGHVEFLAGQSERQARKRSEG